MCECVWWGGARDHPLCYKTLRSYCIIEGEKRSPAVLQDFKIILYNGGGKRSPSVLQDFKIILYNGGGKRSPSVLQDFKIIL